jgi:hypothetical protein
MAQLGILAKIEFTRGSQRNFLRQLYINIYKTCKSSTGVNVDSVV